jgi:hypothetical protein
VASCRLRASNKSLKPTPPAFGLRGGLAQPLYRQVTSADIQRSVCTRVGAHFVESPIDSKVGIALETMELLPLNGLRHRPANGTCGWYIWGGETIEPDQDFFKPIHVEHLEERFPSVVPYLGLAPGWRFLLAPGQEDVWFDESINHE